MASTRQRFVLLAVVGAIVLFLIVWTAMGKMEGPFTAEGLGTWFAAFLTLAVLSFLYDDNPVYRFAESLFIGISAAYWMVQGIWTSVVPNLIGKVWPSLGQELVEGIPGEVHWGVRLWYCVPLIFGIMLLWRLAPKGAWIARWPLALIVGWAAGTNLVRYLESDLTKQVPPVLIPLVVVQDGGVDWIASLSAFVSVFGLLAALIYFFFSVEHKGVFGKISRAGIWVLMITFGAAFGYTVMGRIALAVGRLEFLFVDWTHLVGG